MERWIDAFNLASDAFPVNVTEVSARRVLLRPNPLFLWLKIIASKGSIAGSATQSLKCKLSGS